MQPSVLERDSRGGGHGVEQLGLVLQRRVVDQGGHRHPFPFDEGDPRPFSLVGDANAPAVEIGIAVEVGQPIGELQRRVAERARQCVTKALRRGSDAQIDHQVADAGAQEP